jgi:uncharacterized protein
MHTQIATEDTVIEETIKFVKEKMSGDFSGHDWWHVKRVWDNARMLAKTEPKANTFIIDLAALLHDVADYKLVGEEISSDQVINDFLQPHQVNAEIIQAVCTIVNELSFKGAKVKTPMSTLEGMIVQDADRLDAIGAVGIARTFAYGGHFDQPMHVPGKKAVMHESFEEYKNTKTTSINHFYEKLFLLKDLMNTAAAKELAEQRHQYMQGFVKQFLAECGEEMKCEEKIK